MKTLLSCSFKEKHKNVTANEIKRHQSFMSVNNMAGLL